LITLSHFSNHLNQQNCFLSSATKNLRYFTKINPVFAKTKKSWLLPAIFSNSKHQQVLAQQPNDKNKIYSLHEPDVYVIAKGKDHKQYEYGNKVSIV
jgi:hypothetical protein